MIEELYKNIYRIGVPLKGNPLKELNSYFIRGTDGDLLIDTGFRREDCELAMRDALGSYLDNLRRVYDYPVQSAPEGKED